MIIRNEIRADYEVVFKLNSLAFESDDEAKLIDELRVKANRYISLVAEIDKEVVGHIMFTPVTLSDYPEIKIMGLGPMAVLPSYQNKNIGSVLVQQGLENCKQLDFEAVIVLGHPKFYPRFGFVPSVNFGFISEYKVADEIFMAMELQEGVLKNKSGVIKYNQAFSSL